MSVLPKKSWPCSESWTPDDHAGDENSNMIKIDFDLLDPFGYFVAPAFPDPGR